MLAAFLAVELSVSDTGLAKRVMNRRGFNVISFGKENRKKKLFCEVILHGTPNYFTVRPVIRTAQGR
jgi:hypothetical protein